MEAAAAAAEAAEAFAFASGAQDPPPLDAALLLATISDAMPPQVAESLHCVEV